MNWAALDGLEVADTDERALGNEQSVEASKLGECLFADRPGTGIVTQIAQRSAKDHDSGCKRRWLAHLARRPYRLLEGRPRLVEVAQTPVTHPARYEVPGLEVAIPHLARHGA